MISTPCSLQYGAAVLGAVRSSKKTVLWSESRVLRRVRIAHRASRSQSVARQVRGELEFDGWLRVGLGASVVTEQSPEHDRGVEHHETAAEEDAAREGQGGVAAEDLEGEARDHERHESA